MTEPGAIDWDAITPVQGFSPDQQARAMRKDRPVKGPSPELRQGLVTDVDIAAGRCTIRLGGSDVDVPGVKHLSNYRPQVDDSCWILVNQYDLLVLDRTTNLGPSVISNTKKNTVLEEDNTTSTNWSYFTQGPNITDISVSPSGRLLLQVSAFIRPLYTTGVAYMSVVLNHREFEYVILPDDTSALAIEGGNASASKVILFTGLPPGMYTASTVYRSNDGTGMAARNRHVWALPL